MTQSIPLKEKKKKAHHSILEEEQRAFLRPDVVAFPLRMPPFTPLCALSHGFKQLRLVEEMERSKQD